MQASTTKTCAADLNSSRPWQASIAMDDLSQPEQIGPLFASFSNICMYPGMRANDLINRQGCLKV
jgi:hypothetical protein